MVYIDLVMLINFVVDFLLLLSANNLCGYPNNWMRLTLGAGVGGAYGGLCFLPMFRFMGSAIWRFVSLCFIVWISFGFTRNAIRRGFIFLLLSMALGGAALGVGSGGLLALLIAVLIVVIMCAFGFLGGVLNRRYLPVELQYNGKRFRLIALQDTGNMLRDPLTGKPILIVGGDLAQQITGLTTQQLRNPAEALLNSNLSGLRLVPYKTVGRPYGLLLALRLQEVRIGKWRGCSLVAFAPDGLSSEGEYQALTGGIV